MASKKKNDQPDEISVVRISTEVITFAVKGVTPLIINRLQNKAKRELLFPAGQKTRGDKATTLKHNPLQEFRDSVHWIRDPNAPTYLALPSTAFKSAMRSVAVDLPNASSKAQLGRLTYVDGEFVGIFGVPDLRMDAVRQAGPKRTPDIRTRACIRKWAAIVSVRYAVPILNASAIVSLLANAGMVQGVGDYRPEKGAGNFGTWELVDNDDAEFQQIIATGGREAQIAAMDAPALYDEDTEDLYRWFHQEVERRGFSKQVRSK